MTTIGIIPCRYQSVRFPGKSLAEINGKPMMWHVYRQARKCQALDEVLSRHQLDTIIAPTNSPAWKTDFLDGDRFSLSSSKPAAVAGYPAITLPAGEVLGLPVGITLFGAPFTEEKLIRYAFALEQSTKARKNPLFIHSLEE